MFRIPARTLRVPAAAGVLAVLLAAALPAQAPAFHQFDIDQAASAFTYSGQVSVGGIGGNLVGQPANFNVSGTLGLELAAGTGSLLAGRVVETGTDVVVPTLNAIVPNPIPLLPPLVRVTVTGAWFTLQSVDVNGAPASFTIGAAGAFSAPLQARFTSGTVSVTGLVTQTIQLAGQGTNTAAIQGNLTVGADGVRLVAPLNSTFSFTDPTSGAMATLTISGTLAADDRELSADTDSLAVRTGGSQTFTLSTGRGDAGNLYLLAGSASGTSPGLIVAPGITLPLNLDGYLETTATNPNSAPLVGSFGTFGPLGIATARFTIPRLPPAVAGLTLDHAYVVLTSSGQILAASNAVPLTLR